MKHTFPWLFWVLGILVLCLTGCQHEDADETFSGEEISFGGLRVSALTRGIIEDGTQLESVKVAGWMKDASSSSSVNVFTDNWMTLTYSNNVWTYSPIQRWKGNQQYWFAAVYPEVPSGGEFSVDGTFTVPGYVCTGETDLLCDVTGVDTSRSYDTKVTLTPRHVHAKVEFVIHHKATDITFHVESLKIAKACTEGSLTVSADDIRWVHESTGDAAFTIPDHEPLANGDSLCSEARLVIPSEKDDAGNYTTDDYVVELSLQVDGETRQLTVPIGEVLEAGKSYRYSMTIVGGNALLEVSKGIWQEESSALGNDMTQKEMNEALAVWNRFAEYDAMKVDLENKTIVFYPEGKSRPTTKRTMATENDSEYFSLDTLDLFNITKETRFLGDDGAYYRVPTRNDMMLLLPSCVTYNGNMTKNAQYINLIYYNGFQESFVEDDGTVVSGIGAFNTIDCTLANTSWSRYAVRFWGSKEQAVYHYDYQYENKQVVITIKAVSASTSINWDLFSSTEFWEGDVIQFCFPFTSSYKGTNNLQANGSVIKPCTYYLTLDYDYDDGEKKEYAFRMSDNMCGVDYWCVHNERIPILFVKE